jgi:hypothetical protein
MKMMSMACAVAVMACLPSSSAFAASCESLAKLALKGTAITSGRTRGFFVPVVDVECYSSVIGSEARPASVLTSSR